MYIKIENREYLRKKFLNPLVEDKLSELIIPSEPESSKQKYRIIKSGLEYLKREVNYIRKW